MRRVASYVVAALLATGSSSAQTITTFQTGPGGPPPRGPARDTSVKTGTSRIRGRVVAGDTGQALRKALVRATSPELRESRVATTDANGVFELKDLPAGRYTLSASKGSYVTLSYGQLRPFEPGKPLELADAQTIDKIDFALPRGSVVTGRVVDEFGEPTADVQVMAMRYQFLQGRRRLTPAGRPTSTNDIGEFRIFALPPGQYYLSATLRSFNAPMDAVSDDRSGYAPTYYPGTANVGEAQRITVGVGQTLSDLSIPLVQTRTSRVSGTAVDSIGKPIAGGFIMVMQRSASFFLTSGGGQVRPDGTFTISNLAPGEYTLQVNTPGGMSANEESASAQISVNGDDVSGVQIVGVKPIVVSGRIVIDPAQARGLQPTMFRISIQSAKPDDGPMFGPPGGGSVKDDFSFDAKARPGLQLVRLNVLSAGSGWSTRAVRFNGVDVTDTGIDFRPNEDVSGIEIELTNKVTEVSGLVTNARGDASKDYTVVVFSRDEQRWGWLSRYVSTGRPDQDGRFKVRNLPAGQYHIVALEYVEPGEAFDPDFLSRLREKASTFSLQEGETKTMDVKLSS